MKKSLLAIALAVASYGAAAHVKPYTHYHDANGRVVIGNQIKPEVVVTTETDNRGREIRVTTTTTCVDTRVNRRNNHLRCMEEETTVERRVVDRPRGNVTPVIEPRVQRYIERDSQGRRVIVTVTDTCTRPAYQNGREVCYRWERDIDREIVRRVPRSSSLDLDGDGRTNAWERLLYQGFRDALDNN